MGEKLVFLLKMRKKVEKKGLKLYKKRSLTKAEKEVLHLLTEEFLTIKKIAQRRGTSLQAVYKITKKLKEKGAYNLGLKKVEKVESTFNQNDVRLHGQEFNIKILFQDNKYQRKLERANILFLDGNTIRLYKNSIEVYSGQSFYGKTANESEKKSLEYWNSFLVRLEHDLKVILVKPRARNIRIVNQHYARGDSEICNNAIKNRERIWIYAEEDGKLAFITDDSFGFREDETVHPKTAKIDRKAIDKHINDWRLNNPPTNSQIAKNQAEIGQDLKFLSNSMVYAQKELPLVLNMLKEQISSHLKLIEEYRKENKKWRIYKERSYRKEIKKIKNQTNLNNWI